MSPARCSLTAARSSLHGRRMQARPHPRRCAGWVDPAGEALLARWALAMRAEGAAVSTVAMRLGAVRLASRHAGQAVDVLAADDLRAWLASHANPNTKVTYHSSVVRFHAWLVQERLRPTNPMDVIRRPRMPRGTPRPCASADLAAALDAASPRDRVMLALGAFQGLRAAEIAQVRGEDLDLEIDALTVTGKGGVRAVLPLHPQVRAMAARMPQWGFWFPSPVCPGQPVGRQTVSKAVRRACRAAGVPEHAAHPLRHWFGTSLVRGGADLRTVQTLMRHASLATTQMYVEASDEARRAAVLRLPVLGEVGP